MKPRLLLAAVLVSGSAIAAPNDAVVEQCVGDADAGQVLRSAGKMHDARASFQRCAAPLCPAVVSRDCTRWLGEVDARMPRVDVVVRGAVDVSLDVDGKPTPAGTARALELDPGPHVFRVTARDGRTATESIVLKEGEQATVNVVLPPASPLPASPVQTARPMWPVWLGVGVSAALLGTAAGLGLHVSSRYDTLESRCSPRCSADEVDGVRTAGTVGDVLLVSGIVALAVTGVLFFTRPGTAHTTAIR